LDSKYLNSLLFLHFLVAKTRFSLHSVVSQRAVLRLGKTAPGKKAKVPPKNLLKRHPYGLP